MIVSATAESLQFRVLEPRVPARAPMRPVARSDVDYAVPSSAAMPYLNSKAARMRAILMWFGEFAERRAVFAVVFRLWGL